MTKTASEILANAGAHGNTLTISKQHANQGIPYWLCRSVQSKRDLRQKKTTSVPAGQIQSFTAHLSQPKHHCECVISLGLKSVASFQNNYRPAFRRIKLTGKRREVTPQNRLSGSRAYSIWPANPGERLPSRAVYAEKSSG